MQFLGIVISNPSLAEEVLSALIEAGITTATVVESQGMGRVVSERMPVFAGFRNLWGGAEPFGKFIFSIVDDEHVRQVMPVLHEVVFGKGRKRKGPKGIVFTLPVSEFHKPPKPAG